MSERSIEEVSYLDPFCGVVREETHKPFERVPVDDNIRPIYGIELDKETGNTKIVQTGTENIDMQIQECKDDCGFEGMRKLIATGQARPLDFADDGRHGLDATGFPDNVNDAYRAGMKSSRESADLFAKLGISPVYNKDGSINTAATEQALKDAITKVFNDAANAATKEEVKEKVDETK